MDETKPVKYLPAITIPTEPQPGDWLIGHVAYEVQPDGTLKTMDGTIIEEGDELRAVEKPSGN
jgi:hypothetical protein